MNEIIESLNDMHGTDWSNTFQPWGDRIICHITIRGITRSAVADTDEEAFMKAFGYFGKPEPKQSTPVSLPVPSGEITIAKPVGTTERCIDITCTSNDARSWVEQNLPPYGRLLPPVTSMHNAYRLIVSDAYKVDEVKRYILSQNEDEEISRKLLRMSMNKPNPRVA